MTYNTYHSSGHNSRDSIMTMKKKTKQNMPALESSGSTTAISTYTGLESKSTAMDLGGSHWTVQ